VRSDALHADKTTRLETMPFPWYHPDVPQEYTVRPGKTHGLYIQELKDRAALLMRLGYSKEETTSRLTGNVRWDFELHDVPAHLQQVAEFVEGVYKARGPGGGGPPLLDT
jgi:hypothetical protein